MANVHGRLTDFMSALKTMIHDDVARTGRMAVADYTRPIPKDGGEVGAIMRSDIQDGITFHRAPLPEPPVEPWMFALDDMPILQDYAMGIPYASLSRYGDDISLLASDVVDERSPEVYEALGRALQEVAPDDPRGAFFMSHGQRPWHSMGMQERLDWEKAVGTGVDTQEFLDYMGSHVLPGVPYDMMEANSAFKMHIPTSPESLEYFLSPRAKYEIFGVHQPDSITNPLHGMMSAATSSNRNRIKDTFPVVQVEGRRGELQGWVDDMYHPANDLPIDAPPLKPQEQFFMDMQIQDMLDIPGVYPRRSRGSKIGSYTQFFLDPRKDEAMEVLNLLRSLSSEVGGNPYG